MNWKERFFHLRHLDPPEPEPQEDASFSAYFEQVKATKKQEKVDEKEFPRSA